MGVIVFLLWVVFVLSGLLLCVVILLQEGKGGGLAEAFGGAGAEVFGVKAGGINKLTSILATVFIASIVLIDACQRPRSLYQGPPAPPAGSAPSSSTPPASDAPANPGAPTGGK